MTAAGDRIIGAHARLRHKSLARPDEVRSLPNARVNLVSLGDTTVVRTRFEPGWRWSTDLAPIMKTRSCEVHHLGHSVSGILRVRMDDGEELDIPPDSIFEIPPGHDAWVVGDEPWVIIEWTSGRIASTPPRVPGSESSRPCCLPTSWTRRRCWNDSATSPGRTSCGFTMSASVMT